MQAPHKIKLFVYPSACKSGIYSYIKPISYICVMCFCYRVMAFLVPVFTVVTK